MGFRDQRLLGQVIQTKWVRQGATDITAKIDKIQNEGERGRDRQRVGRGIDIKTENEIGKEKEV